MFLPRYQFLPSPSNCIQFCAPEIRNFYLQLRTLTHTCTIICTNKMSKRARKLPPRYKDNALPLDNWTAETSKLCIYEFVSIAMHAVYSCMHVRAHHTTSSDVKLHVAMLYVACAMRCMYMHEYVFCAAPTSFHARQVTIAWTQANTILTAAI